MSNALKEKLEKEPRPVYVYQIPDKLADGIQSVGLVQLTAHEEMQAAKRSNSDPFKLAYEQIMQAIVQINGEKVGVADGTADKAFNEMSPQVRNLVMTAYAKISTPSEDELSSFLSSATVQVA